MGTPLPFPKKGAEPPPILAHVYCGQTDGWIKMALGREVGLGPGHIVLDEDPAPLPKEGGGAPSPISTHFYCAQTVVCIKMPLGMQVGYRPQPSRLCVRWGPSPTLPSPRRGRSPQFSAHVYCGQMAGCIKMQLGMEVGLSPGDVV